MEEMLKLATVYPSTQDCGTAIKNTVLVLIWLFLMEFLHSLATIDRMNSMEKAL